MKIDENFQFLFLLFYHLFVINTQKNLKYILQQYNLARESRKNEDPSYVKTNVDFMLCTIIKNENQKNIG